MKACTSCSVEKPDRDFSPITYADGTTSLYSRCRMCVNVRARAYNKTESARINRARYKHSVKGKRTSAIYERSEAGKASQRRYRSSLRGRHARSRIDNTRRARELVATGGLSLAEWGGIIDTYTDRQGTMCAYCYGSIENPTMDHIQPLSKGGEHNITNVVPACRSCNSSKGAKPLLRWMYDQIAA